MRRKLIALCVAFIACGALSASAQQPQQQQQQQNNAQQPAGQTAATTAAEQRVPLAEQPIAYDATGRAALAGRLLTNALNGTDDAPLRNLRLVIENRSPDFYTYITGWATFYDTGGVRCGEGMFKLDALAPQESAETDTPGLRLTCAPATWRIVALNLLTRAGDTARPIIPLGVQAAATTATTQGQAPTTIQTTQPNTIDPMPIFVNLSVDGRTYRVPLGSTLEIPVNKKRTRISVSVGPQ